MLMFHKPLDHVGEALYYLKIDVYFYVPLVETKQQNLSCEFQLMENPLLPLLSTRVPSHTLIL